MSRSGGLKPKAVAGGPSVTKFTQRSCTGIKPSGKPNAAVKKIDATSPIFDDIIYLSHQKLGYVTTVTNFKYVHLSISTLFVQIS